MATYQGRNVRLNTPSRISKGEAVYGRKKSKVYVKDGAKIKKVMFIAIDRIKFCHTGVTIRV